MKLKWKTKLIMTALLLSVTQGGCGNDNGAGKNEHPLPVTGGSSTTMTLSGNEEVTLAVSFNNINSEGQVCASIFTDENAFPQNVNGALVAKCVPAATARDSGIAFEGLKTGTAYAVAAFYDLNSNGTLDTRSILGFKVPAEPYGFSRNPGITRMGPPLFSETSIVLESNPAAITINLKKFLE